MHSLFGESLSMVERSKWCKTPKGQTLLVTLGDR
jgi:hypothetical protein